MIRTMLVDDEEPARDRLRRLLGDHDDVDVVAEAADGSDALEKMKALRPDLVFLDIHMPGCTGMEVAASAEPPRPQIVFCTAFDHYAIDAFELHALDYLLKPVHRERLARSIQRVRQKLGATLFYSVYDQRSGELAYFNAGHLPALLFRSGQTNPQRLTKGGMPLGLFADSRFQQAAVSLQENDILVLFTDGVVEAVNKRDEEFGEDRLIRLIEEGTTLSAQRLQESILRAVEDFSQGCPQHDDITVVVARVLKTSMGPVAS